MARDEKRRQKKLEKKRNERKSKLVQAARIKSGGLTTRLKVAASWPIHLSLVSDNDDIHNVILTRRAPSGEVAFAMFLVDAEALGVKDCWVRFMSGDEYAPKLEDLREQFGPSGEVSPAHVRKFVEDAVAAAKAWGFESHRDFATVSLIFGDIRAADCPAQFTFGRDGKPFYISGPYDTMDQAIRWAAIAKKAGGDFVLGPTAPPKGLMGDGISDEALQSFLEVGTIDELLDPENYFDEDGEDEFEDDEGLDHDLGELRKHSQSNVIETTFEKRD